MQITFLQEPTPTITPPAGGYLSIVQVTLACANPTATIHYTLDGTDPTASHGILYSSPFTLYENATVRAIAFETGGIISNLAIAGFSVKKANGNFTTSSSSVNLTSVGALDWVHWGDNSSMVTAISRKTGVAPKIGNYTTLGTGATLVYANDVRPMSWTDGVSPATSSGNTKGLTRSASASGFQITVPADTTVRTLRLYCGGTNCAGKLTAQVTGSATPDWSDSMQAVVTGAFDRNYVITYHGTAAGQTLTVQWTIITPGTGALLKLSGAALSP